MVVQPMPIEEIPAVAGRSLWQDAWIRLRRNRAAVASMVVLVLLALIGIYVGNRIHLRISELAFRRLVGATLLACSVPLILK